MAAEYIDRTKIPWATVDNPKGKFWERIVFESSINSMPTADVIERSTMEILCNEYLSKCYLCDECCAETYCISNSLRTENRDCVKNLITYFTKRNIGE